MALLSARIQSPLSMSLITSSIASGMLSLPVNGFFNTLSLSMIKINNAIETMGIDITKNLLICTP